MKTKIQYFDSGSCWDGPILTTTDPAEIRKAVIDDVEPDYDVTVTEDGKTYTDFRIRYRAYDGNDDLIVQSDVVFDAEPVAIKANPCTAPTHRWVNPHELCGGLDSNPGVWSGGGTSGADCAFCSNCGAERRRDWFGSQRNDGDEDTVTINAPTAESLVYFEIL